MQGIEIRMEIRQEKSLLTKINNIVNYRYGALVKQGRNQPNAEYINMEQTTTKTHTITLTDHPPIAIRDDEWPVITYGRFHGSDHENEHRFQANRIWKMDICVREHADGRRIIYAVYDYETGLWGERNVHAKAGVMIDPGVTSDDLVQAIRAVGATISAAVRDAGRDDFEPHVSTAVLDCIAHLGKD